jgi:hypothetical protein
MAHAKNDTTEPRIETLAIHLSPGHEVFVATVSVSTLLLEDVDEKVVVDMIAGQAAADVRRQLKKWYADHQGDGTEPLPPPES